MNSQNKIICVYDGACPLCTYAAVSYQRAALENNVELINSRIKSNHPILETIKENNINLDHGGVFMKDGVMFGGVVAMKKLAQTDYRTFSHAGLFLKAFGSGRRAKIVYPILKTIRDIWITVSGAGKINPDLK